MEIPGERDPLGNQEVQKFVRGYRFTVFSRIADGGAVNQTVFMKKVHGIHYLPEGSASAPCVRGILIALDRHGQHNIPGFLHFITEVLIHQSSVCKQHEGAVLMLLCQTENIIFTNGRFTAGHDISVNAKLLALRDNSVHIFIGQIQLVPVFRCPAAGAMQVAGRGRIKKNHPGNADSVFLRRLLRLLVSGKACLKAKGHEQALQIILVGIIQQMIKKLCPFSILAEGFPKSVIGLCRPGISVNSLNHVND